MIHGTPNALAIEENIPNALAIEEQPASDALGTYDTGLGINPSYEGSQTVASPVGLRELIGQAFEKISGAQTIKVRGDWRIERRQDRTPVGYAIYKRGKDRDYVGYVGASSPEKEGMPTYETIRKEQDGKRKKDAGKK